MLQYETHELTFKGAAPTGSQVEVILEAEFEKDGKTTKVKGFYAGEQIYKIRFLPEEAGEYHYQVKGLFTEEGTLSCEPAKEGRHGIVRADGTHFRYADGTWFYPFGTTVYALAHQEKSLIDETMETLKQAPFNKIRMCVFPKHYLYNNNDPEYFAFEKEGEGWDTHKPCFAFWDAFEKRINELDQMGIECDLILFHAYDNWGFSKLTREQAAVYLEYAARRLSAFPNLWWSLANEYDLMSYKKEDWEFFAHLLHEEDPYGHLLSNHHMIRQWDFSNPDTTHICVQIKDVDRIRLTIDKYKKPMMVDECRYEGNIGMEWGNISGFEMVDRFWKTCVQGGYCTHGETFVNEEEILWWSKGGKLIGESPERIGFLRSILEELPGPLTYGKEVITLENTDHMRKNDPVITPFFSDEELVELAAGDRDFIACCGEEAYLKYYERQCTCMGSLNLPEDKWYDIDVIDVWDMTRKTVLKQVSGHVEVPLPGKEGMALLAKRTVNKEI